jgi:hypothetical protein
MTFAWSGILRVPLFCTIMGTGVQGLPYLGVVPAKRVL